MPDEWLTIPERYGYSALFAHENSEGPDWPGLRIEHVLPRGLFIYLMSRSANG